MLSLWQLPAVGANTVPIAAGVWQAAQRGHRLRERGSGCCSQRRSRSHYGKNEKAIWRNGRKEPPRSQRTFWKAGKVNCLNTSKDLGHAWLQFTAALHSLFQTAELNQEVALNVERLEVQRKEITERRQVSQSLELELQSLLTMVNNKKQIKTVDSIELHR